MCPETLSLAGLRFSLVGPGRVGLSLSAWAVAAGARLGTVVGTPRSAAAEELARRFGGRIGSLETLDGAGEELLLVALPDEKLTAFAAAGAGRWSFPVVLHTSGSRGASILEPLRPTAAVGSFHPLKAFPNPLEEPAEAHGTFFALDGDPEAVRLGHRLADAWRGTSAEVPESSRLLYHLGARLAAGGVTTLAAVAEEIATAAGLPPAVIPGYLQLARGALRLASRTDHPAEALTGPIARGERHTVIEQLEVLSRVAPELLATVVSLDLETVRQITMIKGSDGTLRALAETLRHPPGSP